MIFIDDAEKIVSTINMTQCKNNQHSSISSGNGQIHCKGYNYIWTGINIIVSFLGILYFVSATVNPILYNLMSKKFRQAFKRTLYRCCEKELSTESIVFGNGTTKDLTSHYSYGRISRHGMLHNSTMKQTSLDE